ncbi:hypothetical protein RvY_02760 [Ramazzottius varieornatus]|uniref:Phosphorylated adapter RNA export protein n=1 Tax=Ramazzottius varieornatus TaxID=947166 RepID=A0A1D1UKU6_RAMVA|nr:hypothetical protein RvY_02760 [Ramazzottius varieornatus]
MEESKLRQPRKTNVTQSDSESDSEDGEVQDEEMHKKGTLSNPENPAQVSIMTKRKRGNAWKDVVVENALVDSLAKVTTTEVRVPKPAGFVDLDAPSNSLQPFLTSSVGSTVKKWAPEKRRNGSGDASASTSAGICGKRKNHLVPKPKRSANWKGGEKTQMFTTYPDLNSEITDEDRLDVAARKAVHQLKEKQNPWSITQVICHLGNSEARKLLSLTKTIEQNGGMLTKDGKSRRTAGGVFITLFRSDAEPKIGKAALKKMLTPPQTPQRIANAAAKHKRAVEKRAQRRLEKEKAVTTDASSEHKEGEGPETLSVAAANMDTEEGEISAGSASNAGRYAPGRAAEAEDAQATVSAMES